MEDKLLYGYSGKILVVDLTEETTKDERLDESTVRKYLGGTALGIKYLYDKVRPGTGWNDPRNCISLASGPLGGTRMGGSGTFSVVTKGPLTNGIAATNANGFLGAYLRHSGYDGILIQGAAKHWVYLYIHDGKAEIKDAGNLLGKDTWETEDLIKQDLGYADKAMSVCCIGPAGENLIKFAAIVGDKGHVAGHNGVGAVMGSKKLKAVAVARGRFEVPLKNPEALSSKAKEFLEIFKTGAVFKQGTLAGVTDSRKSGSLPVKNYTETFWKIDEEKLAKYSPQNIRDNFEGKFAPCWACQSHHTRMLTINEGKYKGILVEEPDFEQFASMSSVIGVTDVATTMMLAHEVDRLGFEMNETGWLIGLVMECFEKGLLSVKDTNGLQMNWGNGEAVMELLNRIALRQGIGNILAEGVMRAAQKIGGSAPNFAIHTMKGNTPRSHDHRTAWNELFDTSVSNTGTLEHQRFMPLSSIGLDAKVDPFSPLDVSTIEAKAKGAMVFEDSLGVCRFNTMTNIKMLCEALSLATGWDIGVPEALLIGRRAVNLSRVFNIIHGIDPKLDAPSFRYGSTPEDGVAQGKSSNAVWQQMLDNYYGLMGWDKSGVPLPNTLKEVGLEQVIPDLRSANKP